MTNEPGQMAGDDEQRLDPSGAVDESTETDTDEEEESPESGAESAENSELRKLRAEAKTYRLKLRDARATIQQLESGRAADKEAAERALAERVQEATSALTGERATLEAAAQRYEAALRVYLAKEEEGIPEHIRPLLDKLDTVERLEYVSANRHAWGKVPAGVPPTPVGRNEGLTDEERRKRAYQVSL